LRLATTAMESHDAPMQLLLLGSWKSDHAVGESESVMVVVNH
jgi:hypothetical protein